MMKEKETYTQLKLRLKLQRILQKKQPHADDPQLATIHYHATRLIAKYTDYKLA